MANDNNQNKDQQFQELFNLTNELTKTANLVLGQTQDKQKGPTH